MSDRITWKRVHPMRVLTARNQLADQGEVVRALADLSPGVADVIAGPPIALKLGFPRDGKTDFELAFPVGEPTTRDGLVAKTLPSLPMFSITHVGPLTGGPKGTNLADTWKRFAEFIGSRSILVGDDPTRFLYHEGLDTVGTGDERFVLEVQYPYHLPMWLDALEAGVAQYAGPEAAARVMAGSEGLAEALDGRLAAEWVQAAVERLDREVPDERERACVLNGCAHHYIVQSGDLLKAAWDEVGGVPLIVEGFVAFDRELSIIAVRAVDGDTAFYPVPENIHEDGIIKVAIAPAPDLDPALQERAEYYATRVMEDLDYVGVLAIELFQVGDRLLANEMAPRVHNSGHWTIEGAETSQFENHVRAVLGLPLGSTGMLGHAAMVNFIGAVPEAGVALRWPDVHLHLYRKEPRPGRKVGHITVRADAPALVRERVAQLRTLDGARP